MLDSNEHLALLRLVLSQPRSTRQALATAALFSLQAAICTALLLWGYHLAGKPGAMWAIISAVLVLQPGLVQSLSASVVRIVANVVGALSALAVSRLLGTGGWQVIVALIVVIFLCTLLRLELALRTACASVIIVMMSDGRVFMPAAERSSAVIIGCTLAVLVQLLAEGARKRLGWEEQKPLAPAAK
jgi:uncharacterized membrane protein YgaE (UPF0421/DUF939 family)